MPSKFLWKERPHHGMSFKASWSLVQSANKADVFLLTLFSVLERREDKTKIFPSGEFQTSGFVWAQFREQITAAARPTPSSAAAGQPPWTRINYLNTPIWGGAKNSNMSLVELKLTGKQALRGGTGGEGGDGMWRGRGAGQREIYERLKSCMNELMVGG